MRAVVKGLIFAVILVGTITIVDAQNLPQKRGLEVNPAYFDVTITSKEAEKRLMMEYTNHTSSAVTLNFTSYNYRLKEETGEPAVFDRDASNKASSLLSYLTIEPTTLTVAPQEKGQVVVTIRNGEELSPGGHYAAVVAQVNQDQTTQNKPIVAPSLSTLLLVRKEGGEKFGLGYDGVQEPFSTFVFAYPDLFHLSFTNSGNTHLILYGTVEIKDLFGRLLYKGIVNSSSLVIFPKYTRSLPVQLITINKSLPFSLNTLVIQGTDSLHKVSYHSEKKFVYVNIPSLIFLIFVISYILYAVRKKIPKKV